VRNEEVLHRVKEERNILHPPLFWICTCMVRLPVVHWGSTVMEFTFLTTFVWWPTSSRKGFESEEIIGSVGFIFQVTFALGLRFASGVNWNRERTLPSKSLPDRTGLPVTMSSLEFYHCEIIWH
jgi:hypothetical protein